jgi:hypothetical protein
MASCPTKTRDVVLGIVFMCLSRCYNFIYRMTEKFSRPYTIRPDSRKDEAGQMREIRGLEDAKLRVLQVPLDQFPDDVPYPKRETNEMDKKAIVLMNSVIKKQRLEAGIEDDWNITPDRFIFYAAPYATGYYAHALAHNVFDWIKVIEYQTGFEKGVHYVYMLHEMVHLGAVPVVVGVNGTLEVRKMGFHLQDFKLIEGENINSMAFLDEAVVQAITSEIITLERDQFERDLNLTSNEFERLIDFSNNGAYVVPMHVLGKIIKGISRDKKIPTSEVWSQCKQSYYNSDLSFLRDIERAFGPGTLRLLDSLDSGLRQTAESKVLINTIKEYFSPDTNQIKRFNLALQLIDGASAKQQGR